MLLELIDEVRDREIFALGARAAALEFVGRQVFRVREHRVDVDIRQLADRGALDGGRRAGRGAAGALGFRGRTAGDRQLKGRAVRSSDAFLHSLLAFYNIATEE